MSKTIEPIEFQVGDYVRLLEDTIGKCTITSLYLQPINEYQQVYYAELITNKDGIYIKIPVNKLIKG